jgi:hypothetical protein
MRPSRLRVGPPSSRLGSQVSGQGIQRGASPGRQTSWPSPCSQNRLVVVADRPGPAGQRQRAAIVFRPRHQVRPHRAQAQAAGAVAHQAGQLAPHQAGRGDHRRGQHGFGAAGFIDRVDPQPVQAARGRHQGDFAPAALDGRQPAVVGSAEAQVRATLFGHQHMPGFGQRIPVLQHAAPGRQRQQALFRKAEAGGGEHAVGIRRHRQHGIAAADRGRGWTFLERVAEGQRGDRQAMRHVARQQRIGPGAPPVGTAFASLAEALQRLAAFRTKGEPFGIDVCMRTGLRQRGAEQMGAIGQAAARLHPGLPSRCGPGLRWRPARSRRPPRRSSQTLAGVSHLYAIRSPSDRQKTPRPARFLGPLCF